MTQSNTLLFTDKYNALAKSVGVQPEEESVAKFFWYAGLRHAFQRGTSSAALLNPVPTVPRQEPIQMKNGCSLPNGWPPVASNDYDPYPYRKYDNELSTYEAKLLSIAMQTLLSSVQEQIQQFEKEVNSMWKYCDKDDARTEEVFKEMNRGRNRIRTVRKQYNTLVNAQRKLKKLSKVA